MKRAKIVGTGMYAPGKAIDNTELLSIANIELDTERLENKIGIKARHIARLRGIEESTADFAEKACSAALADAGVSPEDIGLFIVATDTPEYISPATAILLQGRLQGTETESRAFDVGASCASFATALDTAARIMADDPLLRYAIVVGVYNMPAYVKPGDAFGLSIFADGAGAVVLAGSDDERGYIDGVFKTDGTQWNYIGVYAGGTKKPLSAELISSGSYGLELLQKLPGDRNIKLWPPLVRRLLAKVPIDITEVDHFIFTQINRSVIEEVMSMLAQPMEKTTCIMDRYGYTGSACVPMALHTALTERRITRGDLCLFVASGAGLEVGANLIRL